MVSRACNAYQPNIAASRCTFGVEKGRDAFLVETKEKCSREEHLVARRRARQSYRQHRADLLGEASSRESRFLRQQRGAQWPVPGGVEVVNRPDSAGRGTDATRVERSLEDNGPRVDGDILMKLASSRYGEKQRRPRRRGSRSV